MLAPDSDTVLIRNASAVVLGFCFFERGEAGVSLLLSNIAVTSRSIDVAIQLRKGASHVSHTLSYTRNSSFDASPIDLILRYDRQRRRTSSSSRYYWSLPGTRLSTTARTITSWLTACLSTLRISLRPKVLCSSHSLCMGAASECAAINVPLYCIRIWDDWEANSSNFETNYLDARVLPTEDSRFFFGHLLQIS